MELSALLVTFGTIFLVELPDKTFLATLVLSTRYRPLLVWIGVGLAFTVQTGVAVLLGSAASFLPDDLVRGLAAVMFLVGALLLLREARRCAPYRPGPAAAGDGAEILERAAPATGLARRRGVVRRALRRRVGRPVPAAHDHPGGPLRRRAAGLRRRPRPPCSP